MIEYRPFRNDDPPAILRLWEQAGFGPGAARYLSNDTSFDLINYSQTYFDPKGLILAVESGVPVGFVHAGFGSTANGERLDRSTGVICAVVVHPDHRRRGIGRVLVAEAEKYLRQAGAKSIYAGPSRRRDPFYFGLYGGAAPAGFQESDEAARPFFESLGYTAAERSASMSRSMSDRDPVHFKTTMIRRKWKLELVDRPDPCSWWWMSHYGRLDALYCILVPKVGGAPAAGTTVVGLDAYTSALQEQAVALVDLHVLPGQRRQGLGTALLLDVIKRLRQETITRITANVSDHDPAALKCFEAAGFRTTDHAVVFKAPDLSA